MIEIRPLATSDELQEPVRLQREIWGYSEVDLLPVRLFTVATNVGGQVFGAFDGRRMVGFLLAIPGVKAGGKGYLHSSMMGVLPEYRNQGVGRMLKLQQRDDALARGVSLVEWTFDPLELKNAYFNIERLGVVVRRYVLNQYGMSSSRLHAGLPTDRCTAEWHLSSNRVRSIVEGGERPPMDVLASIDAPAESERSRAAQEQVSRQFLDHFAKGLCVIGFEKKGQAGAYLLGKWNPSD